MGKKRQPGLSWHKPSSSWQGRIAGKSFYFKADKKTDKEAHRKALAEFSGLLDRYRGGDSIEDLKASRKKHQTAKRVEGTPLKHRLCNALDEWIASQKGKADAGGLSYSRVGCMRTVGNRLVEVLGSGFDVRTTDEATVNKLIDFLNESMGSDRFSVDTAWQTAMTQRQFIKWLWKQGRLNSLPRNIDDLSVKKGAGKRKKKPIQVYTATELKKLYESVKGTKCEVYFLLALNCGYTPKDIADLHPDELVKDTTKYQNPQTGNMTTIAGNRHRIIRHRSKTAQPQNHLLWDVTFTAIQKWRSDDSERLLLSTLGKPLVDYRPSKKTGKISTISNLGYEWRKVPQVKTDDTRTFKHLRKSGATLVDRITPGCGALYLGHSPKTVADQAYIPPNQEALDKALLTLERQLAFGQATLESMFE